MEHYYVHTHPADAWQRLAGPGSARFRPSELGHLRQDARAERDGHCPLGHARRVVPLRKIWGRSSVPALVIGAAHDTMDPAHMRQVARRLPQGTYLHCPNGGHMAMYDDQETYFRGLIGWLKALA